MSQERSLAASRRQRFGSQFVRFFIVGVGATVIHWGVYVCLNSLLNISKEDTIAYNTTFAIGYAVSFIANYIVSLKWTFQTSGNAKKGLGFAFSHAINWGMQTTLLNLMLKVGIGSRLSVLAVALFPCLVNLYPRLADPTTLVLFPVYCIVVPMNFLLVRFFLTRY